MDNYNYPEGSDTLDAPWNQPDAPEPTSEETERAEIEIWPFLTWDESATLRDIVNAAGHLNTDEIWNAVECAEACGKSKPIGAIGNASRETITKQATDYVTERAQELASEVDWDFELACAAADDEFDRRREEHD